MELNFKDLFQASPNLILIFDLDFNIVAMTDVFVKKVNVKLEDIINKNVFEVFPDNPEVKNIDGSLNLKQSLLKVIATKKPDFMRTQRYDVKNEFGMFIPKFWLPKNYPVLDKEGNLICIIQNVVDITENILMVAEEIPVSNISLDQIQSYLSKIVEQVQTS